MNELFSGFLVWVGQPGNLRILMLGICVLVLAIVYLVYAFRFRHVHRIMGELKRASGAVAISKGGGGTTVTYQRVTYFVEPDGTIREGGSDGAILKPMIGTGIGNRMRSAILIAESQRAQQPTRGFSRD